MALPVLSWRTCRPRDTQPSSGSLSGSLSRLRHPQVWVFLLSSYLRIDETGPGNLFQLRNSLGLFIFSATTEYTYIEIHLPLHRRKTKRVWSVSPPCSLIRPVANGPRSSGAGRVDDPPPALTMHCSSHARQRDSRTRWPMLTKHSMDQIWGNSCKEIRLFNEPILLLVEALIQTLLRSKAWQFNLITPNKKAAIKIKSHPSDLFKYYHYWWTEF